MVYFLDPYKVLNKKYLINLVLFQERKFYILQNIITKEYQ